MKADFEHRKKRSTAHRKRSEQFEKTAKTKQQEVETLTQTVADLQASSVVLEQQVKKATEVIGNLAGEKESLQAELKAPRGVQKARRKSYSIIGSYRAKALVSAIDAFESSVSVTPSFSLEHLRPTTEIK
ncbi:hypothetical protein LTS18_005203 [Coniosporium uncinatum]|uniref:Uncharacterized protein n=1 Tax=Coniosporium uncinatum TaxID=93489 RepID=A0ACC3DB22_9PEZI|nr:hypothetical protein LTS18_005203 [Coniosporium uncinatum]